MVGTGGFHRTPVGLAGKLRCEMAVPSFGASGTGVLERAAFRISQATATKSGTRQAVIATMTSAERTGPSAGPRAEPRCTGNRLANRGDTGECFGLEGRRACGRLECSPNRRRLLSSQTGDIFVTEADRIAAQLSESAIRSGGSAAWIGLDWLGDAEVYQLVVLGPDLYNGASGIGVFLAAHSSGRRLRAVRRACARRQRLICERN